METEPLKDFSSNCEADFFDALPSNGAKKYLDHSGADLLYYIRIIDHTTNVSTVTKETNLGGFLSVLEKDTPLGTFRGFCDDLESVFWEYSRNPFGLWAVGYSEEFDSFERGEIEFFTIEKGPSGWVFSGPSNNFVVTKVKTWVLDYTFPEWEEDQDVAEET